MLQASREVSHAGQGTWREMEGLLEGGWKRAENPGQREQPVQNPGAGGQEAQQGTESYSGWRRTWALRGYRAALQGWRLQRNGQIWDPLRGAAVKCGSGSGVGQGDVQLAPGGLTFSRLSPKPVRGPPWTGLGRGPGLTSSDLKAGLPAPGPS